MWIDGGRLAAIDQALEDDRSAVDRLLADVAAGAATQREALSACPVCRRDLVRQPLAATGVYASRCPADHGAWAPDAALQALQRFVETHASREARARRRLRVLTRVFLVLLVAAPIVVVASAGTGPWVNGVLTLVQWRQDRSVSVTHWPDRAWMLPGDIPTKGSAIDVHAELLYFDRLVRVLKVGASNRLNMDGALNARRRPDEYVAIHGAYRERQLRVLADLQALAVPPRLAEIHAHVVRAAEAQIVFYGAWTDAKVNDPSVDLAAMLTHPAVRQANAELLTAWGLIQKTYQLDPATRDVLYGTLCAFDVI
jgi:hypothetical protein